MGKPKKNPKPNQTASWECKKREPFGVVPE